MADEYTFQNLAQLSHTAGQIPFILDRANDIYRPLENCFKNLARQMFNLFVRSVTRRWKTAGRNSRFASLFIG